MDVEQSKKLLKRFPEVEKTVKQILTHHRIDYDTDELSWEIRPVKMPDKESNNGEKTFYKLYIHNEFIINVSPMTSELLTILNERYPKLELSKNDVIINTQDSSSPEPS